MKMSPWHVLVFVWLALVAVCPVQAAAPPPDPLTGSWFYYKGQPVTFNADGTADWPNAPHGHWKGTWEYLHNPEVQRHYRVVWDQGRSIDTLVVTEDGLRAHVRNETGEHKSYDVRRAADKPAASVAGPASGAPERTKAAAKPTNPADPVVGEWHWGGTKLKFMADGTLTSASGGKGTWEALGNEGTDRKYRVTWSDGKHTADLTYDPAIHVGHVANSRGQHFDATPLAATSQDTAKPGKAEGYFGAPGQ